MYYKLIINCYLQIFNVFFIAGSHINLLFFSLLFSSYLSFFVVVFGSILRKKECLYNLSHQIIEINNQLSMMKRLEQAFDYDSHSTQQRQRRFNRTSNSRSQSGNSKSSRNRDLSISKFWVKDIKIQNNSRINNINQILTQNLEKNQEWSPPKRKPTPAKAQRQKKSQLTKDQLIQTQQKQLKQVNAQIDKYHVYVKRQNQRLQAIIKQNEKVLSEKNRIQQILNDERNKNRELEKQIEGFQVKITEKDFLIDLLQRQQSSLKKVKSSIQQNRVLEFQKQKEQLTKKIKSLEKRLQKQKLTKSGSSQQSLTSSSEVLSMQAKERAQNRTLRNEQIAHLQEIQKQLYNSRQQVKRLRIVEGCMQRKYCKQIQLLGQKKDKQYQELKNKFTEFLKKYKLSMMRIATSKIKNCKSLKSKRSQSLDSIQSLMLSSDEQAQNQDKKIPKKVKSN